MRTKRSFGKLLREARISAGLTQAEMADLVGVDNSYISRIESGSSDPPSHEKVLALVDGLGITDAEERKLFLLAAYETPSHPGVATREGSSAFIPAAPPLPKRITIGQRIDRIITMADLSEAEREIVEESLETVVKKMVALSEAKQQKAKVQQ